MAGMMRSGEREQLLHIAVERITLDGILGLPTDETRGIVLFAHGSGSGRLNPRNRYVAHELREGGLATLLLDLLTPEEEHEDRVTARWRFDIAVLSRRLAIATDWIASQPATRDLRIGYFGAGTGAAAALVAASLRPRAVAAIASRGGRPDLAGRAILARVQAPTLLIVGAHDTDNIGLNRDVYERLRVEKQLEIIPGATHLFEEPGTLETVIQLARDWFVRHMVAPLSRAE